MQETIEINSPDNGIYDVEVDITFDPSIDSRRSSPRLRDKHIMIDIPDIPENASPDIFTLENRGRRLSVISSRTSLINEPDRSTLWQMISPELGGIKRTRELFKRLPSFNEADKRIYTNMNRNVMLFTAVLFVGILAAWIFDFIYLSIEDGNWFRFFYLLLAPLGFAFILFPIRIIIFSIYNIIGSVQYI